MNEFQYHRYVTLSYDKLYHRFLTGRANNDTVISTPSCGKRNFDKATGNDSRLVLSSLYHFTAYITMTLRGRHHMKGKISVIDYASATEILVALCDKESATTFELPGKKWKPGSFYRIF